MKQSSRTLPDPARQPSPPLARRELARPGIPARWPGLRLASKAGWHRLPLRQMERGGGLTPGPPGNGWDCLFFGALPLPPSPPAPNLPPLGAWLGKQEKKKATSPSQHLCLLPPLWLSFPATHRTVYPKPGSGKDQDSGSAVRWGLGVKGSRGSRSGWWELPPSPEAALTAPAPLSPSRKLAHLVLPTIVSRRSF